MTPIIEVECEGQVVRIRLTPEGPEFLNYDIDEDITLVEMGYDPTECYTLWHQLVHEPFWFFKDNGFFPEELEPTYPVLQVSTGNMRESDYPILDELGARSSEEKFTTVALTDSGYIVYVSEDEENQQWMRENRERFGLSKEFVDILLHAASIGVYTVEFDMDADPLPGFPEFEW